MRFEVGRLVARIQVDGMQTFGRDLQQVGVEFSRLDERGRMASERMGRSLLGIGLAITALVGLAIAKFAEFDKSMSAAGAVIDGFNGKQKELRQAALDAGAVTVFTAKEAADAEAELGRAGINAANILGGALRGSLALAAAGQIEVAQAAEITASTLNQFRLKGEAATHVADLLASGANKAQGGVSDLSLALKQSGLVASQMGLSVEETIGTLSAFANAGLIGSDAGTSFRQALLNLATPTKQQRELLAEYNLEAYDAAGNFIGITALAGKLQKAFKGATQDERDFALGIIFGSDAIRAANVLYNEGADGIEGWTDAVNEAGAASSLAGKLQDNLAGDVEKLGGAFDSALIQTGEGANGVLRDMVQTVTGLIDAYSNLPAPVQQGVLTVGLLTGAVFLFGGALLYVLPKIVEFRLAVQTLNKQVPALGGALKGVASFMAGPWGLAFAAAVIGVDLLQRVLKSFQATTEEITASLKGAKTAADIFATASKGKDLTAWKDVAADLGDLDNVLQAAADQSENLFARFDSTHFGAFEALKEIGVQLGELAGSDLPQAQEAFRLLADETDGSKKRLWELLNTMPGYKQALIEQLTASGVYAETLTDAEKKTVLLDAAQGNATDSSQYMAGQYDDTSISVDDVTLSIEGLVAALNDVNGLAMDSEEANIRYRDTLHDVAEAAKKSSAGIDLNTEAGRKNRSLLLDLAEAGQKAADANLKAGGSAADYAAQLTASRDKFIQNAIDFGATADEAEKLADHIYKIPSKKEIEIIAKTAAARKSLDDFIQDYKEKKIPISAVVRHADDVHSAHGNIFAPSYFAEGGFGEQHVAQIARAGATRVWAEPETGGEAYIPLASDKRSRSTAILEDVATMFGFDLVPKSKGSAASTGPGSGPRESRIVGTLELVNGKAYIEGVVDDRLDAEDQARGNGVRE